MRIAFISDSTYPWFNGGIEKRRYIIMRKLVAAGNNVHCFTMYREGMPGGEFTYQGIRYHCVGNAAGWAGMYKGGGKRRSIRMPLQFSIKLFTKIFPYKFDVVDADSFPFLHLFPLYFYTRIRGARFAITWHEVWSRKFWTQYLSVFGNIGYLVEWFCARIGDVHIANASTTQGLLEKVLGVKGSRIIVFPAAIDTDEINGFVSRHECRKKNRFVVVNRLVRHKRVQLAIDAIAKTKAKLVVVGTGPELNALRELANKRASGKVVFEQGLSTEQLFTRICESAALIMPSEREGLSLVTLEALALGTPVVIADTSSLPRELRGMCIEARENEMAGMLNRIIKNKGVYAKRSKKLRSRVLAEFSGDASRKVYERIAKR